MLRALHRDTGYLVVGLTVIYALSGLAVNHIADWDPNYKQRELTIDIPSNLTVKFSTDTPAANQLAARNVLLALNVDEVPQAIYVASPHELDITLKDADVHVDLTRRTIALRGQEQRFLLKTANFLHLNRGKKAWTFIADSYAVLLLFLAGSGMFMIKGRQGLLGRGAVLVLIGAAVPVIYVVASTP